MARTTATKKTNKPNAAGAYPRIQLFKRARVDGFVYIHNDHRLFVAPLSNISAGGLFIEGVTTIPIGNSVRVVVKSSTLGESLQARGTVVRIEKEARRGLAVEFLGLSEHAKSCIKNCVSESQTEDNFKILG